MSKIGYTYGSEWHLLRYLGYHREALDRAVRRSIPYSSVPRWLDRGLERRPTAVEKGPPRFLDDEFAGVDFLTAPEQDRLRTPLRGFWPYTGNLPNWDAVARLNIGGEPSWLIVEAKSHLGELNSICKAKARDVGGGRDQIIQVFRDTQQALGVGKDAEAWLGPFYQFSNRLAFLNFFLREGVPAHLLCIYFLGDRFPEGRGAFCPETEPEWQTALAVMERHVGWQPDGLLSGLVHKLFLPVRPPANPANPTADETPEGRRSS